MNKSRCISCDSSELSSNLPLGKLPFFYGVAHEDNSKNLQTYDANLTACEACNLIQQIANHDIKHIIQSIYKGLDSSLSVSLSNEGWGLQRANAMLEKIQFHFIPDEVLEIGCQDGYFLYQLKKMGARKLIGVEPGSVEKYKCEDFNPTIYNEFFTIERFRSENFDTIVANFVLEHVENPKLFIEDLCLLLKENGQLIISVPNAHYQLLNGDPGLFVHEHYSYFTKNVLVSLLENLGLEVLYFNETLSDYYVTALKKSQTPKSNEVYKNSVSLLNEYQAHLKILLQKFEYRADKYSRLGFWGAANACSNLLAMTKARNYTLFDVDSKKHGKYISGLIGIVQPPTKENIVKLTDAVCITPLGFRFEIKKLLNEYNVKNFTLFDEEN